MIIMMKNLVNAAPSSETIIRVYPGKLVLSAATMRLLEIDSASRVAIRTEASGDKGNVYIGNSTNGYSLSLVGKRGCIRSAVLCRAIANKLQGYGTYKVEADNPVMDYSGTTFYSIFFRKYN